MVIGSLKAARGFFAAHSRCTTETIANCSCAHTYSCSATPDRKQSRRPCSGPWLRRPRPRNGSTARPMSGEPQRQTENLHALRFGCSRCGEVRLFDQVLVFSHSHSFYSSTRFAVLCRSRYLRDASPPEIRDFAFIVAGVSAPFSPARRLSRIFTEVIYRT